MRRFVLAAAFLLIVGPASAQGLLGDDGFLGSGGLLRSSDGDDAKGVVDADEDRLTLGGFIHADAIFFEQDALSRETIGDVQDVGNFRRARIIASGSISENVDYRFGLDFGGPGRPSFLDTWFDVALLGDKGSEEDVWVARVGRFKVPQGMATLEASTDLTFLERATPTTFVPFRQAGAMLFGTYGDRAGTVRVAGYRYPANVFGAVAGDAGYGAAGRTSLALGNATEGEGQLLHMAISGSTQQPNDNVLRFTATPGVGFNELDFRTDATPVPAFADTGSFAADGLSILGGEVAYALGPVLFRGEVIAADVRTPSGRASLGGWYAETSWAVTGEARGYNRLIGVFKGLEPATAVGAGGTGAIELAARYDTVTLTDGPVTGGRLRNVTLGVNWVPVQRLKIQTNVVFSGLDESPADGGESVIAAVRAQFVF